MEASAGLICSSMCCIRCTMVHTCNTTGLSSRHSQDVYGTVVSMCNVGKEIFLQGFFEIGINCVLYFNIFATYNCIGQMGIPISVFTL